MVKTIIVLCLLFGLFISTGRSQAEDIVVTPSNDQVVSVTSQENVTFTCQVGAGTRVIWEVNGPQIPDGDPDNGFFVENNMDITMSTLIITAAGRAAFQVPEQNLVSIPIRCSAFTASPPGSVFSPQYQIVIFGPPPPPRTLALNPDPDNLSIITLTWQPPLLLTSPPIAISYNVSITGTTISQAASMLSVTQFTFTIDVSECEEATFSVVAINEAGASSPAVLEDTIPISATVDDITRELQAASIRLEEDGSVEVEVTFPPTTQCSASFPISNYTVNVLRVSDGTFSFATVTGASVAGQDPITVPLRSQELANLRQNEEYQLSVTVCIDITCRESGTMPLMTTDVQSATITYFGNLVLLSCNFTETSPARGCVLELTISNNGTETFTLPRDGMATASQCNTTNNQIDAYDRLEALDWESDGTVGTLPIPVVDEDTFVVDNFTSVTGCSIGDGGGLSAGAIVGIVIGIIAFVVIVTVLIVVFAVFRYNIRDKLWGKVNEENDMVTVDIEKELLMHSDMRPGRRRGGSLTRGGNRLRPGAAAPEPPLDSIDSKVSSPGSSIPPAGLHPPNTSSLSSGASGGPPLPPGLMTQMSDTGPPAIQLDISDQRKVRLHLNRSLIRKVLEEHKRVSALEQTTRSKKGSARRMKVDSEARNAMLLPIHSLVRILPGIAEQPAGRDSRDLGDGDDVRLSQL